MSRANFGRKDFKRYTPRPTAASKPHTCPHQDDDGAVCGKTLTAKEYEQDGMCGTHASELWNELFDMWLNDAKGG